MSLVLSSLKAYICWIKVLLSAPLTASSISLFGLLCSATLCLQITICWCRPGNLGCKAARPVPAVGSVMVAHGLPPSEVMRHDGFDGHVMPRAVRERGVHKQSGASVSLLCLIHGGGPGRQHEIKPSSHCRLYTTVRLERDKHCLGGRVCTCGQNSGLLRFCCSKVSQDQSVFFQLSCYMLFLDSALQITSHLYWFWHNLLHLKPSRLFSRFPPFVFLIFFAHFNSVMHELCSLASSCTLTFAYAWGDSLQSMPNDILSQLCECVSCSSRRPSAGTHSRVTG